MQKVVCVVDKKGTALDRLAQGVIPYHNNLNYVVCDIHPKKPSPDQLARFEQEAKDAQILDFQYFRTAEMLAERYPWVKDKKRILTHNNPYSITESNWNGYDAVVANNLSIHKDLENITDAYLEMIPLTVDVNLWEYNHQWRPNKNILMVANRIESKKGILPVAKACKELGLNFHLVGAVSDMSYFNEIVANGVIFHQEISDKMLRELYYSSTVLVCNSVDNFESGVLPILEAMDCGTPVLTRSVGHVPDLFNGENMVINEMQPDDAESLKNLLNDMLANPDYLDKMRDNAWHTARNRNNARRAYCYQKLYRKVLYPYSQTVSVIVPIYDKPEVILANLEAIKNQTYKNIELIVADDSVKGRYRELVAKFAQGVDFPVRYLETWQIIINVEYPEGAKDYGLARARNIAADNAISDLLIFNDTRQIMEPTCVEEFVRNAKPRYWLFGDKGAQKSSFVENLSCIYRNDFIITGGFNERCDRYGGISEDIRRRIRYQGLKTEYIANAKAVPMGRSGNRSNKRKDIVVSKNRIWQSYNQLEW